MEFRVLGPFEVRDDGDEVLPIGAFRQRAVLALLTIHAGQVLSTDRIIDELWAGSPPPAALKTLHAYVSRLRRVVGAAGAETIVRSYPGYLLAVDAGQIDAARFEQMISDASEALRQQRPADAAEMARHALGLWRGAALADFAGEPFAVAECQRLEERRLESLELRIDADLALGRHSAVVSELESLVADHPLRERLWEQLMTALYRSGRQADALTAYGRVRTLLVDELGIEPGPGLRSLEHQVLEQSPELVWQPEPTDQLRSHPEDPRPVRSPANLGPHGAGRQPPAGRSTAVQLLPLVGRDEHIAKLTALVQGTSEQDTPQLVLVTGEAGCGKTRLLAEVGRRLATDGVLVVSGSAEGESSLPYGPFGEVVRGLLAESGMATLDRLGHLRDDLGWLVPELGPPPDAIDLGHARTRLFEAIVRLISQAGSAEPLVLVIDDAHRLEEGSASLIRTLLDRRSDRPVMVVLGIRTEVAGRRSALRPPVVDWLRREGTITVEVGRLTTGDVEQLVRQWFEGASDVDPSQLASLLSAQTAGIPLLVREVLRESAFASHPGEEHGGHSASLLVQSVILNHLGSVSPAAQELLRVAAVAGPRFDVGLLTAVTGSTTSDVEALVDEALTAGILVEADELDVMSFDHGLLREIAESGISAGRKTRLHARFASVLSDRGADIEAARHGLRGYTELSANDAVELALAGADSAISSLDFDVAIALCQDALVGPAARLDPRIRADLLLRSGQALSLTGRVPEAEETWREAARLARACGDHEQLARIALATAPLGHAYTQASALHWELLSEALERNGPGWTPLRLLVASEWLLEAVKPHRRSFGPAFVDEIVEAAVELGDRESLAAAYHARHVLARWGPPSSLVSADELVVVAEQLGQSGWLFNAYLDKMIDCALAGDGVGLDKALDRLGAVCDSYRDPRALWLFELAAGSCARIRGEFEASEQHVAAAAEIGGRYGMPDSLAAVGATAFLNAFLRGGLREIRSAVTEFAEQTPHVPAWTFAAGLAAADDDDPDGARVLLARGVEIIPEHPEEIWVVGLCLGAELAGQVGAEERHVQRLLRLLDPYTGQLAVVGTFSSEFGPIDRSLGILCALNGDEAAADEHFERAIAFCRRLDAGPWELRTRADWVAVDRWLGRRPRPWWDELDRDLEGAGLQGALDRMRRGFCGRR